MTMFALNVTLARRRLTPRRTLAWLLAGTALAAALPAAAQDCALAGGQLPPDCANANAGTTVVMPYTSNAEADASAAGPGPQGFAITVNGRTPDGRKVQPAPDRGADLSLAAADIQVKHSGLYAERRLNVATSDLRSAFRPGENVVFRTSTNYPFAIRRAELRITGRDRSWFGRPETVVVPAEANGEFAWTMPAGEADDFTYVLRVYDATGRYDETVPLTLSRSDNPAASELNGPVVAAGEGEDRTAVRNIPTEGGVVTVSGSGLPQNARVTVMGAPVPVDTQGRFVTQRILPFGAHDVSVAMSAPGAGGLTIDREVVIPRSEWFYAGLADFTLSRRGANGIGSGATETDGRLAFYAKGNVEGKYRITASVDTGERGIDTLFNNFFEKTPESLIDRLDPDDLYPTYGDDSTIVEDAPTSGRLFLKVERGDSHLMWGDFRNRIEGTRYFSNARNLYGAQAVYRSPEATADGERRTTGTLYAANPESLPQRDEMRGTGGSAYFLKRQDIVPGSETLRVETVDPDTGRVVATRQLVVGQDYRIDYIQGTVILDEPLSSSASTGTVVSGSAAGDYDVNLVSQYEYTPTLGSLDGAAFGGRVETWLPGDRVRLGVSGLSDTTDTADLKSLGADARLTFGANSHLDAEIAQSDGVGFGKSVSTDGGLSFVDIPATGSGNTAQAYRVEGTLDLADIGTGKGTISAYFERKEAGFNTVSEDIARDQRAAGIDADIVLSARSDLRLRYKDFSEAGGEKRREGTADIAYRVTDDTIVEAGLRYLDAVDPTDPTDTGKRTDVGVRVTRTLGGDNEVFGFVQGTVDRSGGLARNDRFGIGGSLRLSDSVTAKGEVSDGTSGVGARARLEYQPSEDSRYFLGYELDPDREIAGHPLVGKDNGGVIVGAERTIGPATTIYAENKYDMFGERRSLTTAYGVAYTPDNVWRLTGGVEVGRVRDSIDGDFDRTALSFGANYDDGNGVTGKIRLEARVEDHATDPTRDRETYLMAGAYSYEIDPDWRFVTTLDALVSASDQSAFLDGRYVEASLGFAYRPVENDRVNALFKYTYLYDLPGVDQVSADGSSAGDRQRSHILSLDTIYELNETWELGGKLAYRSSETAPRAGGAFTDNSAGLAAIRATWHVVHNWDAQGEVRALVLPSSDSRDLGVVASAYRHINNNVKLGVGYNFGRFSDDLRNVTLDDEGLFVNLVAKF